jgi:hypothetical protein
VTSRNLFSIVQERVAVRLSQQLQH